MSTTPTSVSTATFARFLDLEQQARAANSIEELAYCIVNDSQPLFSFRHAALVINGKVRAVTGVTQPAPHAPFVAFVERACTQLSSVDEKALAQCRVIQASQLDEQSRKDWLALSAPEALWSPLNDRQGNPFGAIWYAREQPWQSTDQVLAEQLSGAFSHAWLALEPQTTRWRRRARWKIVVPALLLLGCLFIPVRQSVLAPAEVIPHQGRVVAAPLDGVIQSFTVLPNQSVRQGEVLVRFDSTTLKAQADVAERALNVAEAEHRASSQRAFQDADSKARLDFLAAQVAQKRAERDYANALLSRAEIRAERDGIAVFADATRWMGKPVRTGERLMELADPALTALRIELDVGDAIQLQQEAPITLFLDSDPLTPHAALLERIAYESEQTPAGNLAYRLDARFTDTPPRIGLRGTAKISGDYVPLAVYLFRRPLAVIRQAIGL
ncbi:efflux RND transporter periplasmic adaptor subunit [Pectobacterium carotovorum]|uniref:HlyD family efflux transporter periplasmic adaptor subunit n=1 Tax=Pectobacterium carotovorum subsp. carotovorum TaxID=555 RepID=A0AAI9KZB4_PECCC|nr:HlyD family efflux transporter periplasmic adaptor subunit [Pectobacterium carotovorum]KAA3668646.1 HlyD family efflux transporter periplasmic adaptor subunit [Pectobacterium carotovorum subsp. carotovorum]KHT26670.1 multidrug transporter [Pectobacterium carotovorum subsp. carotovorum]MCA6972973.1 HlyD family efflux transporter periplasmic adaptor subunit [Pectobacterium carotovorum]MDK9422047.1 HlyD family efflux transporter periplasmic adaptor subunit [Pectobacterium carotovorum]QHP55747.